MREDVGCMYLWRAPRRHVEAPGQNWPVLFLLRCAGRGMLILTP